jgi:hypothetical protein
LLVKPLDSVIALATAVGERRYVLTAIEYS